MQSMKLTFPNSSVVDGPPTPRYARERYIVEEKPATAKQSERKEKTRHDFYATPHSLSASALEWVRFRSQIEFNVLFFLGLISPYRHL